MVILEANGVIVGKADGGNTGSSWGSCMSLRAVILKVHKVVMGGSCGNHEIM